MLILGSRKNASEQRWRRIIKASPFLSCPACGAGLDLTETECTCRGCAAEYPVRDHRIYFTESHPSGDEIDGVKARLRQLVGRHYRTLADLVAPNFPVLRKREINALFDTANQLIIDCGSGSQRQDDHVIALDFTDHESVDIVCDVCRKLPFADGSIDGSMSWGVIEHLEDPATFVAELARCAKPGGKTIHMVPFLYHFHSSPHDFYRFTDQGLAILFKAFRVVDTRNASGPVSYIMLGLVEFFSVLLSFGHERAKGLIYLALCGLTAPVKILDWPFINRKAFLGLAPCIVIVAERAHVPAD